MPTYYKPQSPIQSGEDFIYPITTADQVMVDGDTRLNAVGVYLENIDYSTDTTVYGNNATTLGGRAPGYYTNPRNLLDNSDFRNPVNQRGATSYTGSVYTIDRWKLSANTLNVGSGGITLVADGSSSAAVLTQYISGLRDGTYTQASNVNGTIYTRIIQLKGSTITTIDGSNAAYTGGYVSCTVSSSGYFSFQIRANATYAISVEWAALYEGTYTAETLPPYVPKGYAAELAECRRYAKYITGALAGIAHGYESGKAYATIFTSGPRMRINPSVDNYSKILIINGEYYSVNFTPITGILTIASRNDSITFWIESSEISAGKDYYISCEPGVLFSADL